MMGHNHTNHRVKMHYFLKKLSLYSSGAWIRQIKCIVMVTKEGSIIVNLVTLRQNFFMLGHRGSGQKGAVKMMYNFDEISIYSILIAIVLRCYNATSLCHC